MKESLYLLYSIFQMSGVNYMEMGFAMLQCPGRPLPCESSSIFFYLNCEEQKKNGCECIHINVLLCFILAKMGPVEI